MGRNRFWMRESVKAESNPTPPSTLRVGLTFRTTLPGARPYIVETSTVMDENYIFLNSLEGQANFLELRYKLMRKIKRLAIEKK
jgi:hypothetical protein